VAAAAAGETLAERLVAAAAGNVSTDPGTGGTGLEGPASYGSLNLGK